MSEEKRLVLQLVFALLYQVQWFDRHCIALVTDEEYFSDQEHSDCLKIKRRR